MRVMSMLLVAAAASSGPLIASCSVFGGENEPAEVPDGVAAEASSAGDAAAPLEAGGDALDAEAGACVCGAGSACSDAGTCIVTSEPDCASRVVVAAPGSYVGRVCAGSGKSKPIEGMCANQARLAHVFLIVPSGPPARISQVRVHATVGDIDARTYTPVNCGDSDSAECISVSVGMSKMLPVDPGDSIAVGSSGAGCRDYTIDFF